MKLLPENKLVWSPVVVNSRMNRERNSSGINSYEQEFKFRPEEYLASKVKESGHASWLDLCCGHGNALIQTARYFEKYGNQDLVTLTGIDLVDTFQIIPPDITCIKFVAASLIDWIPGQTYDLITCVHGIHYLGDKLKVIETAISALHPDGLFVANIDLNNIVIQGKGAGSYLKDSFKKYGFVYNSRRKVLERIGHAEVKFDVKYLGADDNYGPNYTGQDSVTSYYSI
ncbi:class I SAM-dependent methyltransferase [Ferruginibacter profundus]